MARDTNYLFLQTCRVGFPKVAARQYADARAAMRGSPARQYADCLRGNAWTFRRSIQCGRSPRQTGLCRSIGNRELSVYYCILHIPKRSPGMNAQEYALD